MVKFQNSDVVNRLISMYGSADWTKWGVNRWTFYDYCRYGSAGISSQRFFSAGLGATDPVSGLAKTLEETNVPASGKLGQEFILTQIRMHIHLLPKQRQATVIKNITTLLFDGSLNTVHAALYDLSQVGTLTLKLGNKDYAQIVQPFVFCPPGFGVDIDQHAATGTTASGANNAIWSQQSPSPIDVWQQKPEQWIEADQTLEAILQFLNGTSPAIPVVGGDGGASPSVNLGLLFDGYLVSPMQ